MDETYDERGRAGAVTADEASDPVVESAPQRSTRPPGRPRDERAERAILTATLQLTAEVGLSRMTIAAVAERAGVGKATIYRRWSTKAEMVLAAFTVLLEPGPVPDTGSVRGDLHAYQRGFADMLIRPGGDTVPHLAAAAMSNPDMQATLSTWVARRRAVLRQVLARGVERGELRPDVDLDLALELFSGPLVYRMIWAGLPVNDEVADELVDMVLEGLAVRGPELGAASRASDPASVDRSS